ncbi:MAG: hypothetical protein INR62_13990 [Rhodospirillales bacterium]|nr:hypothetical protein [Acetobacter sp.]
MSSVRGRAPAFLTGAVCLVAAAVVLASPRAASAQCGGYYHPPSGIVGALMAPMIAQQQAQACAQARAAEAARQQYYMMRSQQAEAEAQARAQQAQADALVRQQQIERQQATQRAAAAARAKKETTERAAVQRAQEEAQLVAEKATNNICKDEEFAHGVIDAFNRFKVMRRYDQHVIDIEHVTTDSMDADHHTVVCHGTFLMESGLRLTGNFEVRKNVAGDMIYLWSADSADGGARHAAALRSSSMHDIQTVVGPSKEDTNHGMAVVPAKTEPGTIGDPK